MTDAVDVSVLQVLRRDLGEGFIANLLHGALTDIHQRLDKAEIAIKLSDRAQIRYLAHSVRSNLSTCGAMKAADLALSLEQGSQDASMEQLQSIYDQLEAEAKRAEEMILQYITSPSMAS